MCVRSARVLLSRCDKTQEKTLETPRKALSEPPEHALKPESVSDSDEVAECASTLTDGTYFLSICILRIRHTQCFPGEDSTIYYSV